MIFIPICHWNHSKFNFGMILVAIWYEYHTSFFAVIYSYVASYGFERGESCETQSVHTTDNITIQLQIHTMVHAETDALQLHFIASYIEKPLTKSLTIHSCMLKLSRYGISEHCNIVAIKDLLERRIQSVLQSLHSDYSSNLCRVLSGVPCIEHSLPYFSLYVMSMT